MAEVVSEKHSLFLIEQMTGWPVTTMSAYRIPGAPASSPLIAYVCSEHSVVSYCQIPHRLCTVEVKPQTLKSTYVLRMVLRYSIAKTVNALSMSERMLRSWRLTYFM